jgi:hypothetical protein
LVVDLDQVIPDEVSLTPRMRVQLDAAGHSAGSLDLSALYQLREERAYARAQTDACANASKVTSCNRLRTFIEDYPDGPHAGTAQAVLNKSMPVIDAMADDQAWGQVPVDGCAKSKAESVEETKTACKPVQDYLTRYPQGRHQQQAQKALEQAQAHVKRIAEAQERAVAEEERAALKAEQERKAAECKFECFKGRYFDKPMCERGCLNLATNGCLGACQMQCSLGNNAAQPGCVGVCTRAHCGGAQ